MKFIELDGACYNADLIATASKPAYGEGRENKTQLQFSGMGNVIHEVDVPYDEVRKKLRALTPEERETYYVAKIVRLEKDLAAARGATIAEAEYQRSLAEPQCYLCSSRDDLRHFGANGREINLCTMCLSHGGTRDWMGAQ